MKTYTITTNLSATHVHAYRMGYTVCFYLNMHDVSQIPRLGDMETYQSLQWSMTALQYNWFLKPFELCTCQSSKVQFIGSLEFWMWFLKYHFQSDSSYNNALKWLPMRHYWWQLNIDPDNGLDAAQSQIWASTGSFPSAWDLLINWDARLTPVLVLFLHEWLFLVSSFSGRISTMWNHYQNTHTILFLLFKTGNLQVIHTQIQHDRNIS